MIGGHMKQTSESVGWVLQLTAEVDGRTTLKMVCSFSGHGAGGVSALAFADDSPYLISGGNDGSVILWNWQQPLPADVPVAYEAFRFSVTHPRLLTRRARSQASTFTQPLTHTGLRSADTTIALWDLEAFLSRPAADAVLTRSRGSCCPFQRDTTVLNAFSVASEHALRRFLKDQTS